MEANISRLRKADPVLYRGRVSNLGETVSLGDLSPRCQGTLPDQAVKVKVSTPLKPLKG